MGPKSILRLMRTLGPSLASLAQSSWSLLSNVLGGRIASLPLWQFPLNPPATHYHKIIIL